MPMNRSLYPANWNAIAMAIKREAQWRCQECDRPCRPPGTSWEEFAASLEEAWYQEAYEEVVDEETGESGIVEKRGRFTLTVAHLDQNPANNDPSNLQALCPKCHLRYDAIAHWQTRRRRRRERMEAAGQMTIWEVEI